MPCLDTVGVSELVEARVGAEHIARDPRALLAWAWDGGAGFHDLCKRRVHADLIRPFAKSFAEGAIDTKLGGKEHHSWIWRIPKDRKILIIPRKDSVAVSEKQTLRTEISTDREQSILVGEAGVGKEEFVGQCVNGWLLVVVKSLERSTRLTVSFVSFFVEGKGAFWIWLVGVRGLEDLLWG